MHALCVLSGCLLNIRKKVWNYYKTYNCGGKLPRTVEQLVNISHIVRLLDFKVCLIEDIHTL